MAKSQRQLVYEALTPYAEANLKKIKVQVGTYMGNKMCHHNARHFVENGTHAQAAAVLSFVPKSGVNVHFINKDNNVYVDNTLGYLSRFNTYFLIKEYMLADLRELDTHKSCMYDLLSKHQEEMLGKVFTKKQLKDLEITHDHI